MSISIRAGLVGLVAVATLVACGKKPEQAASDQDHFFDISGIG